jgi:hypothetical protein
MSHIYINQSLLYSNSLILALIQSRKGKETFAYASKMAISTDFFKEAQSHYACTFNEYDKFARRFQLTVLCLCQATSLLAVQEDIYRTA